MDSTCIYGKEERLNEVRGQCLTVPEFLLHLGGYRHTIAHALL
jgi:hypothetical protein